MSDLITYDDKIRLKSQNVSEKYKVTASNMNEIKSVVNNNAEDVGDITTLTTTDKTSIVNAINELNAPEKWVSVGTEAPTDGERVWFKKSVNLLDVSISSQTINGVTLTANNDGSVTCNGTASATIIVNLLSSNLTLPSGTYTLSGCPSGGGISSNYKLDIYKSGESSYLAYDSGNSASFTLTETTTFDKVRLVIFSGYSATNLTFYPMLEEGSTATTYEPYIDPSINVDEIEWYSKPKVLWSGRATSVNVDLRGYSLIEVIFCSNDSFYNSLKVPVSGSTFSRSLALCNSFLTDPMVSSGMLYLKYGKAILTQSGITIKSNVEVAISNTAGQIRWSGAGNTLLYITTIIGYK